MGGMVSADVAGTGGGTTAGMGAAGGAVVATAVATTGCGVASFAGAAVHAVATDASVTAANAARPVRHHRRFHQCQPTLAEGTAGGAELFRVEW